MHATPQQNGVAECTNRILNEGITSLSDSHLPAHFWGEALSCYQHALNRSPSAAVSGMTPTEAFYGCKPSVSHLRVFRCCAYAHIQKDKCSAFQPKSQKCIFLGYPLDYKGWKCWDPVTSEVFISRDVRFVETEMPGAELGLSGPRYEPLLRVQPGSVGEPGNVPAPASSSSSVPPVEPALILMTMTLILARNLIWTILMMTGFLLLICVLLHLLPCLILILYPVLTFLHLLQPLSPLLHLLTLTLNLLLLILALSPLHLNLDHFLRLLCLPLTPGTLERLLHLVLLMSLVLGTLLVAPCANGGK